MIIIGIMIIVILITFGIYEISLYSRKKYEQSQREKLSSDQEKKQKEEIFQKYRHDNNIPENANVCICTNIIKENKPIEGKWKVFIWRDFDCIYICGAIIEEKISKITIPIDNIKFYTRKGEIKTTTVTKGGDINIGNAILGGICGLIIGGIIGIFILGGVSAFVGLLAGVFLAGKEKITTTNEELDNRKTYLNYLVEDKNEQILFSSPDYKILYELIPEKDMDYVENNKIIEADKSKNINEDIYKDIEKLAELRDKGILTEEEFNQKKQVLLDRI